MVNWLYVRYRNRASSVKQAETVALTTHQVMRSSKADFSVSKSRGALFLLASSSFNYLKLVLR